MPRGVRITDRDKGFRSLLKRVKSASKRRTVKVGIIGGGEVADVASIHEFGLGDHPERSFIRAWADQDRSELEADERKLAESIVKGTNTHASALEKLGLLLAAKAQKFIQSGRVQPPTIKPDGGNTTLIDTGQLVSSITHEVE